MDDDCYLDDDGGPEVQAVEAVDPPGHRQSLHVRVGPVFHEGGKPETLGVWIEYQNEHGMCIPQGPVLLTPEVWRELARAVDKRLKRKRRRSR
jgi:hypothetical protein